MQNICERIKSKIGLEKWGVGTKMKRKTGKIIKTKVFTFSF